LLVRILRLQWDGEIIVAYLDSSGVSRLRSVERGPTLGRDRDVKPSEIREDDGKAGVPMNLRFIVFLVLPIASVPAWARGPGDDFDARIAPILARRCLDCHSGPDPKGKLDLSGRAPALRGGEGGPSIIPGRPAESAVLERIADGEMPPKTSLPEAEVAALRDWIAAGAVWGTDPIDTFRTTTARRAGRDWWAFHPVVRPEPPKPRRKGWARTPIDAFVLLSSSRRASRRPRRPTGDR
jgi:hypothetical protein